MSYLSSIDADEDTINTAQENLLAQLASLKKPQREKPYFKDDELVMEEKDVEQEFSGTLSDFKKKFVYASYAGELS